MQPRGRAGALVVTAAVACVLGFAPTALASTSGAEAQSTARPADLIPDASWHGRPIKRPDRTPLQVSQPVGSIVIEQGAGFRQAGGSDAVREIQRRLRELGYRPGPVDGAFGPRTHSSVAWFQIKHRLPATGAVDGATLNLLRFRTHGSPAAAPPRLAALPRLAAGVAHGDPAPRVAPLPRLAPVRGAAPAPPATPASHHPSSGRGLAVLLLALALALVFVASISNWLLGGAPFPDMAQLRRAVPKRPQADRVPARSPVVRRGRPATGSVADQLPANGASRRVVGYAVGRDERDFARQQRAMERICGERGWTLSALVKERDAGGRKQRRKPGLSHVLRQVAAGGVGHLIVGRLQSLAHSPAELAVVLEWCSRRDVGLVALDVGLDTTTADGRLAARRLGAMTTQAARRQPPGNGHARMSEVR
jgi:peptidoglycan hydrolase-like protein with peptidoglycan-binding domain